jgi:hypothetical protein
MTELLKQAIALLRTLPDDLQNQLAEHLIRYVNEISSWNDDLGIE